MKYGKNALLQTIIFSFLFVAIHFAFHNDVDHQHDDSCSVYVLEQLFNGADAITLAFDFFLFSPFVHEEFARTYNITRIDRKFIRDPPFFF